MKLILFLLPALAFANYPLQNSVLLAPGANSLTVTNSGAGGANPYLITCGNTGSDRCRVTVTQNGVPPSLVETTVAASITSGTRTVTVGDITGITRGLVLEIDPTGTHETVQATAVNPVAKTFTAVFSSNHTGPVAVVGTVYAGCSAPCTISINRNWGQQRDLKEIVDSSGNSYSPRRTSQLEVIPEVEYPCAAPGTWSFPIEVIGQDNYTTCVQVTVPGGTVLTNRRFRFRLANHGYNTPGQGRAAVGKYDGMLSFQINNGSWTDVINATCIGLDENKYAGPWVNYVSAPASGPVPNCSIGGVPQTIEIAFAIPDNLIQVGTNPVRFRFNGTDGTTSGARILDFNFDDTSAIQQADSTLGISVASNVATFHCNSSCNSFASTGDDVYIYGWPDMRALFGGPRHILSTPTGSTFTFTPCNVPAMNLMSGACSSPNGTWVASTPIGGNLPSLSGAAQQRYIYVTKQAIPQSQYSYTDPATFVAPVGSSASRGLTVFTSQPLTSLPGPGSYTNYALDVFCKHCHADDGSDLKYFNFSPHSIQQRSLAHGLSPQMADDVVAYVLSLSTGAPAHARPWNPVYQPGPGLYAGTIQATSAGAGIDAVLGDDQSFLNYAAPGGDRTKWAISNTLNTYNLPLQIQFLPWNKWLPICHPEDCFATDDWFNYPPAAGSATAGESFLTGFQSAVTPGDLTSFAGYAPVCQGSGEGYMVNFGCSVNGFILDHTLPNIARPAGFFNGSMYPYGLYSVHQWSMAKTWYLAHTFDVEQFYPNYFTNKFGSAPGSQPYIDRGIRSGIWFYSGFHESMAGIPANQFDNTQASFAIQSNTQYILQIHLDRMNGWHFGNVTVDNGYCQAFSGGTEAGGLNPNGAMLYVYCGLIMAQGSWGQVKAGNGNSYGLFSSLSGDTGTVNYVNRIPVAFMTAAGLTGYYTAYAQAFVDGTATQSAAFWQAGGAFLAPCHDPVAAYTAFNPGNGNYCDVSSLMIPYLVYYGVSSTLINSYQAAAAAIWPGHDFTVDRAATFVSFIGPGGSQPVSFPLMSNCVGPGNVPCS